MAKRIIDFVTIGHRLFNHRIGHGMTRKEVASKLSVTVSAICMWENGYRFPRPENLIALCDLYGVTIDEIVRPRSRRKRKPFGALIDGDELLHIVYDGENVTYEKEVRR